VEFLRELMMKVATAHKWKHSWAYDGRKAVVAAADLCRPGECSLNYHVEMMEHGRMRMFLVVVTAGNVVKLSNIAAFIASKSGPRLDTPQDALQVLDMVLKQGAAFRQGWWVMKNSSFIFPPQRIDARYRDIGGLAEAWMGCTQTLRPVQRGLTVNIDMSVTAFVKAGPVMDLVLQELRIRDPAVLKKGLDGRQRRKVYTASVYVSVLAYTAALVYTVVYMCPCLYMRPCICLHVSVCEHKVFVCVCMDVYIRT
jgi:eukaryotic translation initiation factor 2C